MYRAGHQRSIKYVFYFYILHNFLKDCYSKTFAVYFLLHIDETFYSTSI